MGDQAQAGAGKASAMTVEEEIIHMSMHSHEPLPMLEVIAERVVLSLAGSLKSFTAAVVDVTLAEFEYTAFQRAAQVLPRNGLLAVCQADPWDDTLILSMDSRFLFAALELMFGGRPSTALPKAERGFTSIEKRVARRLFELMLEDLRGGFRQVGEVSFAVERIESNPQFATITQPNAPCVRMLMDVAFEGGSGQLSVIVPYGTLDPIRPSLTKVFYGERLGGDDTWRRHLSERIEGSSVTLTAVLHERRFPMREVLDWKPGDTIDLHVEADHQATVHCAGMSMFRGAMGQRKNGVTAVRITQELNAAGPAGAGREARQDDDDTD